LQTRATRKDPQARFEAKWKLIQLLFRRGWARQSILDLLYVLDWMMKLPDYLSVQLWQNVETLEQEKRMAYVSSFERIATEKGMQKGIQAGMQQGMQQGIQAGMLQGEALALQKLLTKRFGAVAPAVAVQIEAADLSQIGVWFDRAIDAPSLGAVFGDTPPPSH
jgi:predicted transposase YdaD